MQRYTMILWRKADHEDASFAEIAKRAYDTLTLFHVMPDECRPKYKTVSRRKNVSEFSWEYESFCAVLEKSSHKDTFTGCVFPDLGYCLSFFSSLKDKEAFRYSIQVGNKNKRLINSLVVDFSLQFDIFDTENSDMIAHLFENAIRVFEPYWGCLVNNTLERQEGTVIDPNTRTSKEAHWLTYWSDECVELVGKEKLESLSSVFPNAEYHNGLLKLQRLALNADNEGDIWYVRNVRKYLF